MYQRLENSWAIVKSSWKILQADNELMVFPIISFTCLLLISASFLVPSMMTGLIQSAHHGDKVSIMLGFFVLFVFYVVSYIIIFYCNTAMIGCALIRLNGGDPTVNDGFRIANNNFASIIEYAVIAATVGIFLQWLSERGAIGKWVASILGMGWSIATFLVVPVLVTENMGPIKALKRSTTLMKKTWGEQIIGSIGINFVFASINCIIMVLAGAAFIFLMKISLHLAIFIAVVAVLTMSAISLLSFTLTGIYAAAVYEYATTAKTGPFFNKDQIMGSFKKKE